MEKWGRWRGKVSDEAIETAEGGTQEKGSRRKNSGPEGDVRTVNRAVQVRRNTGEEKEHPEGTAERGGEDGGRTIILLKGVGANKKGGANRAHGAGWGSWLK